MLYNLENIRGIQNILNSEHSWEGVQEGQILKNNGYNSYLMA